jgi:hypothetical protein
MKKLTLVVIVFIFGMFGSVAFAGQSDGIITKIKTSQYKKLVVITWCSDDGYKFYTIFMDEVMGQDMQTIQPMQRGHGVNNATPQPIKCKVTK